MRRRESPALLPAQRTPVRSHNPSCEARACPTLKERSCASSPVSRDGDIRF
jgi:hypothetical protein